MSSTVSGTDSSIRQTFTSSANILTDKKITFAPISGSLPTIYVISIVMPQSNDVDPYVPPPWESNVTGSFGSWANGSTGDDSYKTHDLTASFPFYGTNYSTMYVGSNGYISFSMGYSDYSPSDSEFQDRKLLSFFWRDLDPSSIGTITYKYIETSTVLITQFTGVPEYGYSSQLNNIEIRMYLSGHADSGKIEFNYGTILTTSAPIVGISKGSGTLEPITYTDTSTYPSVTTNTTVPLSGAISINSVFYGKTFINMSAGGGIGEYGNDSNTILFSGDQGSSPLEYTKDLSSADYAGTSVIGNTGHVFFRYETGTYWQQDPQLYEIDFDNSGTWVKVGQSASGTWGYSNWKTTERTTNSVYKHTEVTWNTVTAGTSPAGRWYRDTGGTPSSSTGVDKDYHIYHEGSYGSYSQDNYLRSPEFTFTSNTIKMRMFGYGYNINTMYLGIYVTG
jgi:hypothetical protein